MSLSQKEIAVRFLELAAAGEVDELRQLHRPKL